ncbi:MAG: Gfo/Idh/MocA family oxidoreductase [Planctomycetaceae bacterium]
MNIDQFLGDDLSRRRFLSRSAAGVAAGLGAGVQGDAAEAAASPGERVRIGVIGVRRRGLEIATSLAKLPGAEVSAICDVDGQVRKAALRDLGLLQSRVPRSVSDARRLFDDDAIDAVVIATPDHAHVPLTLAACEAGKDIYLEAPVFHRAEEEAALRVAVAKSNRVLQCGLQQRSGRTSSRQSRLVQSGELGEIGFVRAWAAHKRTSLAKLPRPTESRGNPLAEVDYRAWLGVAPTREFDPLRFHHHWRWFWDYGAGELGNLGVHLLDVARWGVGVDRPLRVTAQGRRLEGSDAIETPDTMTAQFEYPGCTIVWEHRLWSDFGMEGRSAGVAFHGTRGTLIVDRGGWKVYGLKNGPTAAAAPLLEPHLENFLACVRSRQTPAASIDVGCTSTALCQLANAAFRAGAGAVS